MDGFVAPQGGVAEDDVGVGGGGVRREQGEAGRGQRRREPSALAGVGDAEVDDRGLRRWRGFLRGIHHGGGCRGFFRYRVGWFVVVAGRGGQRGICGGIWGGAHTGVRLGLVEGGADVVGGDPWGVVRLAGAGAAGSDQ